MSSSKRTMVTSALPYANGPIHIGHIAGAYLPADIYVRHLRSKGEDVAFICGSDEHGAAITLRAKKEGVSPKEIVDKYHVLMQQAFTGLGIDFDYYHRTSAPEHHENAQAFFKVLNDKGAFEVKTEEQYFDEEAQQFLADRYIQGTCPNCSNERAFGDQCESCGSDLSPTDLINPVSSLSGSTPVLKPTSLWYLPMGNHEDWLRDFIVKGELDGKQHHDPKAWKNHVIGQCKSWIDGGLHSRAMTRDLDWGVPVPIEGADGKVLYVWLDAPIGYISATKAWAKEQGKDWKDYWQNEDTDLIHFIGKDNIVFHCIIFPILLKSHGEYNLPKNVPANEFMNLEGQKISTSRNWAVWVHEYLEEFPGKEDEMRYVLGSIMPEQKDSEFTWGDYKDRVNNELADVLGNFVNRAFVLTKKYYDGVIPALGELNEADQELIKAMADQPKKIDDAICNYRFREAQMEAMNVARLGNKYLADQEPWKVIKSDPERVKTVIHLSLQCAANCAVMLDCFLPKTGKKIAAALSIDSKDWSLAGSLILEAGSSIEQPGILFQKIEQEFVDAQVAKLEASKAAGAAEDFKVEAQKESTTFENFSAMDIRVGSIIEAEKVKKTKKLLKLTIDTGIDKRTVVSGIAESFAPEDIIGQQVCLLVNLEPRTIKGIESQGMVLMAEKSDGSLAFVAPSSGGVGNGMKVS
jgi:methionyl-tRNA synthetase